MTNKVRFPYHISYHSLSSSHIYWKKFLYIYILTVDVFIIYWVCLRSSVFFPIPCGLGFRMINKTWCTLIECPQEYVRNALIGVVWLLFLAIMYEIMLGRIWFQVNINSRNGLMQADNKLLSESLLTNIYIALPRDQGAMRFIPKPVPHILRDWTWYPLCLQMPGHQGPSPKTHKV